MANYYHIDIESNNLTADVAAEILTYIGKHHTISDFRYYHGECINGKVGGKLYMYIRGISDFSNILEKYNIQDDEIKCKNEFEHAWTAIFEQYFADLPITKEYHSTLEKNINEDTIQLDWDGKNWNKLEDYFKTCWGSRNFRFDSENGVIIGIKEE